MAKLFGTNGIRGVFGDDLTLDFIINIVPPIANFFKKGPILIGYDGRKSSILLSKMITAVLSSVGIDSKTCGMVPTPCLQFATKSLGYQGAIMITASHNPPEYNGIKVSNHDGIEISREDELIIEKLYFDKKWKISKRFGIISSENRAIRVYLDGIKKQVNSNRIKKQRLRVALDLGNGVQSVAAPLLCRELGCQIILLNEQIDGDFPGRGSEPTPQNLGKLSMAVKKHKADFGIAFDGDGDRSIFCDNKGEVLTGDRSALLLSKFILSKNPKSKIVTSVNSSSSIEKIASKFDSKVIRTKVGSVEVSRLMKKENAIIGFEENGGFMYGRHNHVRDGSMAMALMLDLLASTSNSLSQELETLPPSFTTKGKIKCTKSDFRKILSTLRQEPYKKDFTDGIKIIIDKSNWVMVRLSGTEPIARIYAESDSQENLDNLFAKYLSKINLAVGR